MEDLGREDFSGQTMTLMKVPCDNQGHQERISLQSNHRVVPCGHEPAYLHQISYRKYSSQGMVELTISRFFSISVETRAKKDPRKTPLKKEAPLKTRTKKTPLTKRPL